MAGNLFNKAKAMAKKAVTSVGFQEDITLKTPNGLTTLQTTGLASKHWINFDSDGNAINSKNAHITLDEQILLDAGYPVRNLNQEVSLRNHRVSVADSSGVLKEYVIIEVFPSETFGLIACILGDFK